MIAAIKANADLALGQFRSLAGRDFAYDREAVAWMCGYIERLRLSGQLDDQPERQKLVSVFGSFLGECIVSSYGGAWREEDGQWCVMFDGTNGAFPFSKVEKQMTNGLEDSIESFFTAIPVVFAAVLRSPAVARRQWWRFWK